MKRVDQSQVRKQQSRENKNLGAIEKEENMTINDVWCTTGTENTMRGTNAKLCPGETSQHLFECVAIVEEFL